MPTSNHSFFYRIHTHPTVNAFFTAIDTFIATVNKNIAVLGLTLGVILTATNVFLRTLSSFNPDIHSLTWGEEIARYCFIWSALFGAAYGFRKGVHIAVMTVIERLPAIMAKYSIIFSYLLCAVYLAFMTWAGYMTCELNYDLGFKLESFHDVHLWYFLLCLPLSFLAATYRVLEKAYESCWIPEDKIIKKAHEEIIHDAAIKD